MAYNPYGGMARPPVDPTVAGWFHSVDTDRSGHVSVHELQRALALGGLNFSLAVCAQLIHHYDKDWSRTIDIYEFGELHSWLVTTQQSFRYFDRDNSGSLTIDEVFNAMQHAGFQLDRPAFEQLFKSFDPDNTRSLSITEFMAMAAFLKSCTNAFSAFDPQRTGHVSFNFSQFVYAAANTR